jgi:Ca2+-binding EF-hand superfamily protein
MKIIRMIPCLAPGLLALCLMTGPASVRAEEPAKEKPLTKNQQLYDADHDGRLSDEEKAAAKAAATAKAKQTREANLAKYDANKDGKLDDDEKARKKLDEQSAAAAAREAKQAAKEATTP